MKFDIGLASTKSLCKLIKVCVKSNVTSLKLGDIQLEFGTQTRVPILAQTRADEFQAVKITEEAIKDDRAEQLSQEVEDLRLSDPLAYEKFIEGTLGDAGGVKE